MQYWKSFVKAGNAVFTLENHLTGERYTYKVKKHDHKDLWFVRTLIGPENTSDYRYIGMIFEDGAFRLTRNSKCSESCASFQWFKRLNELINTNQELASHMRFYPAERCGRCGRQLTVPASIECGFGPECVLHVGLAGNYGSGHLDRETARKLRDLMKLEKEIGKCMV